ncbi:MAG: Gfo/Idh/MocA family oxidoreductase [Oscillospiraceae bacterium]|nr:Gfo/Idh/MocA family oxidoreductase [Oscillospiraceae bacterium]
MKPVKTAVIGCGAISDIYLTNMTGKYSSVEVVACCAKHRERAEAKAARYQIRAADTDEILKDPEVELIVVLTPAPTHYALIKKALLAGKHVYSEKPIATDLQQAKELLSLANGKNLRLSCAPETFLGSALQTARKALDDGLAGEITSFHIVANRDLTALASMFPFLRLPGGGICYDYGVYYLTALCSLLGPVEEVYAKVGNYRRIRKNVLPDHPEYGLEYVYDNESQVNALLTTRSGITGTFSLNGDSAFPDQAYFSIQGTKGILLLGDANQFGGEIRFMKNEIAAHEWETLSPVSPLSENCRGLGPADMARCICTGGSHLASKEMACHVLDIVEQIIKSGETGQAHKTETVCERPAVFADWNELLIK